MTETAVMNAEANAKLNRSNALGSRKTHGLAISAWLMQRSPIETTVVKTKVEAGIQKASDEEILSFIQNDEAPLSESIFNSDSDMDESDIKTMLANVSDSELEQFANESIDQNNSISN